MWFTESSTNKIGKVTTSGSFTEYSVPTTGSTPFDITSGPDGNIWFTENAGNNIARFALPTGTFSEYAVPTTASGPTDITAGPGGSLFAGIPRNHV